MPVALDSSIPLVDVPPALKTPVSEKPYRVPFTVIIDTAEQQPFSFAGLRGDSSKQYRPLVIEIARDNLGRHPNSLGDYCIAEFRGRCHLERKSIDDALGTFMGWGERLDRFQSELANLNAIDCGAVIVECDFSDLWKAAPETPNRRKEVNEQSVRNQVRAWQQQYPRVQWLFCGGRREAEEEAFRWMWRFYERHKGELKGKVQG